MTRPGHVDFFISSVFAVDRRKNRPRVQNRLGKNEVRWTQGARLVDTVYFLVQFCAVRVGLAEWLG